MYGIDISKHNGDINLEPYKGQFVIIRAGYGNFTKDEKFDRNVNECKRLGIPFGVYLYSYALNEDGAKAEAEALLKVLEPIRNDIKVGVWFDMEDADGYKRKHGLALTHDNLAPICYAFAKAIEDAGYYSGIYTGETWLHLISPECDRFDKWVARWGTNDGNLQNDTSEHGTLHQYTSKPLDKDIMYADISRYTGGEAKPEPAKNPLDSFTDEQLADKVMAGEFGAGDARKNTLGARYEAVQAIVNAKAKRYNFNLAEDGSLGTASVKALQTWLGTPVDGRVSGQYIKAEKYMQACVNGVWEFSSHPTGSIMVRALQNKVGSTADGIMGQNTVKALQRFLEVSEDGYLGPNTARALQHYLNRL